MHNIKLFIKWLEIVKSGSWFKFDKIGHILYYYYRAWQKFLIEIIFSKKISALDGNECGAQDRTSFQQILTL